jgi:hypothetical protein
VTGERYRIVGEGVERSHRAEKLRTAEEHIRLTFPGSRNWKADGFASKAVAKENVSLLCRKLGIARTI